MKVLSIHPEYGMEILNDTKTEEYRTWTTKYRGDLLIYNSAKKTHGAVASQRNDMTVNKNIMHG